ncbi:MAG: DUF421 domain-containing protein [Acidobacteriota bacterium]|nr:DUF421 domain-containing protein [Acidobacteriota bacterium]
MQELSHTLEWLLGSTSPGRPLGLLPICLRAVIIYIGGLALLRLGENRLVGKETAFDIVLGFVLGSVLSRGINGQASVWGCLLAGVVLVSLHQILAILSAYSHRFGTLVKGTPDTVVRHGEILWEGLRKHRLTHNDLEEALRLSAHFADPGQVEEARVERSGEISIIPRKREPKVLEVRVHEGVQTVRIEIS